MEQYIRRLDSSDILLSDCNREDFRIRNRSLMPKESAEIFHDTQFDTFNRNGFAFGVVHLITRRDGPLKMHFA